MITPHTITARYVTSRGEIEISARRDGDTAHLLIRDISNPGWPPSRLAVELRGRPFNSSLLGRFANRINRGRPIGAITAKR